VTLLEVSDLTVRFGRGRPAVDAVSFILEPGQRLGLIGESGSGKTLTALAVMGLLPDAARFDGSVLLNQTPMLTAPDRRASQLRGAVVSMVFQEPMSALDPTMMVGRQLAEVVRLHASGERRVRPRDPVGGAADGGISSTRARVLRMLTEVELPDPARIAASYPHQLSGGQRQRAMLAMAMINNPDLIICDEPTTALDVTVQARVLRLLGRTLDDHGTACLFISHDLAVVAQVCDQVMVMLDGRIVELGSTDEVFGNPQHAYTRGLVAASRLDLIEVGQRLPTIDDVIGDRVDHDWS